MTPRVTLRKALEDEALLGDVLGGDTWHTWRSILLAAMGEPLQPDELSAFKQFTRQHLRTVSMNFGAVSIDVVARAGQWQPLRSISLDSAAVATSSPRTRGVSSSSLLQT